MSNHNNEKQINNDDDNEKILLQNKSIKKLVDGIKNGSIELDKIIDGTYYNKYPKFFMDKFVEYDPKYLKFFYDLQSDEEYALKAVSRNGDALEFFSAKIKDSEKIVLAAIKNTGHALSHASHRLRNEEAVVYEAVLNLKSAFLYASTNIQIDTEYIIMLMRHTPMVYLYLIDRMKINPKIKEAALKFSNLSYASLYILKYMIEKLLIDMSEVNLFYMCLESEFILNKGYCEVLNVSESMKNKLIEAGVKFNKNIEVISSFDVESIFFTMFDLLLKIREAKINIIEKNGKKRNVRFRDIIVLLLKYEKLNRRMNPFPFVSKIVLEIYPKYINTNSIESEKIMKRASKIFNYQGTENSSFKKKKISTVEGHMTNCFKNMKL
jgi:hypothetical protein